MPCIYVARNRVSLAAEVNYLKKCREQAGKAWNYYFLSIQIKYVLWQKPYMQKPPLH